jgi:RNA polymerase sigma factor (sigma-70 family)
MEDLAPPVSLTARRRRRRGRDPHDLVVEVVAAHAEALLRTARRHSACAADAEDAYQRALEIFVRSAHRLDAATAHRWLHVVVKREAWAVAEARGRLVGVEDAEALDALDDGRNVASVEERSERFDELTRAAEALGRLKPQEVTALWLKAEGLSYAEIAERQSWTYTKVNRCISEGRRAFLARYGGIESGAECQRWAPILSAIADGEATPKQLADARPHLRNCPGCRTTLAGMREGMAPAAALLPVGALPALGGLASAASESAGSLVARLGDAWLGVHERAAASVARGQAAVEAVTSGKLAAATASVAVLAGGGAVAEREIGDAPARAAAIERTVDANAAPAHSPAPGPASDASTPSDPRPHAAVDPPAPAADGGSAEGGGGTTRRADRDAASTAPPSAAFAPEVRAAEPPPAASGRPAASQTAARPPAGSGGEFAFEP